MSECGHCGKEIHFGGARCGNCGTEVGGRCLEDLESKGGLIGERFWLCPNCDEYRLTNQA